MQNLGQCHITRIATLDTCNGKSARFRLWLTEGEDGKQYVVLDYDGRDGDMITSWLSLKEATLLATCLRETINDGTPEF